MVEQRYKCLRLLLGAYFHQDWPAESADWKGVVRHYRDDVSQAEAEAAAEEIVQLLAENVPEPGLSDRLVRDFHCYYDPRPDLGGPTLREWLSEVAAALR
jgi:hypothetical protein